MDRGPDAQRARFRDDSEPTGLSGVQPVQSTVIIPGAPERRLCPEPQHRREKPVNETDLSARKLDCRALPGRCAPSLYLPLSHAEAAKEQVSLRSEPKSRGCAYALRTYRYVELLFAT